MVLPLPDWVSVANFALVPFAVGVGLFRYGLLGIEAVLRRGLVYGGLTAAVIGLYMVVAALTGSTVSRDPVPAVITAAVLAVGLNPLRERLQRVVDRMVYGERRDPFHALEHVGDTVASAGAQDTLQEVLRTIATAVRSPAVAVVARDGRLLGATAEPEPGPSFPLLVSGESVGLLQVADRAPGASYGPADLRLLDLLAPQVAVVVHALHLATALEAERDRVVAATELERDRLRRDLHDGLGPSLSGVGLGLAAVHDALEAKDSEAASRMVDRIRVEIDSSVGEVRRIIDDLRPASLDEAGLATALRRQAFSAGVPVTIAVDGLPPLPPEVETAAYRIATEALTNVGKHARASHARVELHTEEGILTVVVTDDGRGLAAARNGSHDGVGLTSMNHRAQSLGGQLRIDSDRRGTTVTASLPVEPR
jgi:signal transduction histidine kinase